MDITGDEPQDFVRLPMSEKFDRIILTGIFGDGDTQCLLVRDLGKLINIRTDPFPITGVMDHRWITVFVDRIEFSRTVRRDKVSEQSTEVKNTQYQHGYPGQFMLF